MKNTLDDGTRDAGADSNQSVDDDASNNVNCGAYNANPKTTTDVNIESKTCELIYLNEDIGGEDTLNTLLREDEVLSISLQYLLKARFGNHVLI